MLNQSEMEQLLEHFFKHYIRIKMYHFQTNNFGAHKATDDYLIKFLANFDRFMEVAQQNNRVRQNQIRLDVDLMTDQDYSFHLDTFSELLRALEEPLRYDNDLSNIRDEMLADVNQLKYLLSFK